jgi:F-type H+-transporting ATPase subunit gamma
MSDLLSDIRARMGAAQQLETVITAMRGVASARTREAQERLAGVRAYANLLGDAISSALALPQDSAPSSASHMRPLVLAFCAEQGFAGAFSERILDEARRHSGASLYLIGNRGLALASEQGLAVDWSAPMISHVEEAPELADRIAEALYERLSDNRATHVVLVHSAPETGLTERPLLPLDYARFPPRRQLVPPLVTLAPQRLLASLAQEYVFAALCEAVILSFAAENEARMQAMIAAKNNVRKRRDALMADYRRLRQDQITEEVIELAAR